MGSTAGDILISQNPTWFSNRLQTGIRSSAFLVCVVSLPLLFSYGREYSRTPEKRPCCADLIYPFQALFLNRLFFIDATVAGVLKLRFLPSAESALVAIFHHIFLL